MSKSPGLDFELAAADRSRFAGLLIHTTGCTVWCGAIGGDGYGRFSLRRPDGGQRTVSAHVVAAVIEWGQVEAGATVLHDCDFRLCVRTNLSGHVRVSTQSENVRQAVWRGRSRGPMPGRVDVRGPAGASHAVRDALRASADRDPVALALVLAQVLAQGDPLRDNVRLF
ncbi:MAG: hypothetical protein ACR2N4_06020 [Jatrophihabitans sp.]